MSVTSPVRLEELKQYDDGSADSTLLLFSSPEVHASAYQGFLNITGSTKSVSAESSMNQTTLALRTSAKWNDFAMALPRSFLAASNTATGFSVSMNLQASRRGGQENSAWW